MTVSMNDSSQQKVRVINPFSDIFGVACGRVDQATLCAVLFRKRAALDQFWADNPKTKSGLVTRWPGVSVLWLRSLFAVPTARPGMSRSVVYPPGVAFLAT